jgi:hypothetical protein
MPARYLPVQVYHSGTPPAVRYYIAQLRLGRSTEGGSYTLYTGTSTGGRPLKNGRITGKGGGGYFPLVFSRSELPAGGGWLTVEIELAERGTRESFTPYRFSFYVPARP